MLLGNHEFYMVPMVRFEAIELMKLLEQVLEDPAVYLRLGHQWKLEGILTLLRKMDLPRDMVATTTPPILAVDD